MSTTTMKTDTMSKVLPGDKSGLPWEIWQMILSYLNVQDLCRACTVSKTWHDLILSLDGTRWKELYLKCKDWKHPYWPLNVQQDPPSWKQAYHDQYLCTRQWSQCFKDMNHSSCLYVLKRRKERRVIRVGPDHEHSSLKSALAVANDFDRIEVYPGIYDEQIQMTSKIPFELVGVGELGSVILVVCIEQTAITGRVSNLVLRAPWFTGCFAKIRCGYLQLDNCILEEGILYIQHPGACHIRFCTFRKATVILHHVNVSIIENCEFCTSNLVDVIVEGHSNEEKNWAYSYLKSRINSIFSQNRRPRRLSLLTMKTTESQSSNLRSITASTAHLTNNSSDSVSHDQSTELDIVLDDSSSSNHDKNMYEGLVCANRATKNNMDVQDPVDSNPGCSHQDEDCVPNLANSSNSDDTNANHSIARLSNSNHSNANISSAECDNSQNETQGGNADETEAVNDQNEAPGSGVNAAAVVPPLNLHNGEAFLNYDRPDSARSMHSRLSYESDEDSLSFLDDLESGRSSSPDSVHRGSPSSSSDEDDDIERLIHSDSDDDSASGEESVIMLPHLRQKDLHPSLSAQGAEADNVSISSQSSKPIPTDVIQDSLMRSVVDQVQGCVIHQCRMLHSKGGVMVTVEGHAVISECDISTVGYGVRCIQHSTVLILKNRIHHCRKTGIIMRQHSTGLIAGNDIHSNMEAGIDIRKNADPIVQNNQIHHGKRSGVVVLGSGRGQIRKNDVYENREAGIYILYGGNPTVSQNQIFDGKAAGVAVNENGRGFIFDNKIRNNQWGGVDIRHGGDPLVSRNSITDGIGDGIVIGEMGSGALENNVISYNAGCGIWIMSASTPYLHGNQINNNGDSGIVFVNKTNVQHVQNMPESVQLTYVRVPGEMDEEEGVHPPCDVATVQYNNIYHNSGKGMVIQLGETVNVHFNAIHANQSDGISIQQDAAVILKSNSVTNNRGSGVVISSPGIDHQLIHVHGNGVYDNRDQGIVCRSRSHISHNDVVGNQHCAISLDGNQLATVVENRLHCEAGACMKMVGVAHGVVENNVVYEDSDPWIRHDAFSQRFLLDNTIQHPALDSHGKKLAFNKTTFLSKPGPRPAIDPPPAPTALPALNFSAVTQYTVPSGERCEQGSKLCIIL